MDFAIVDLQGFKDDFDSFIVKEFSVLTKNIKFHDIIKSTCEFDALHDSTKKSAEWLINFHHGLAWNDGYITTDELRKTLEPILRNKIIYVKGKEKLSWLREIMFTIENLLIVNLEDLGCDLNLNGRNGGIIDEPPMICSKHKNMIQTRICALRNAVKLKLWFLTYCKRDKKT